VTSVTRPEFCCCRHAKQSWLGLECRRGADRCSKQRPGGSRGLGPGRLNKARSVVILNASNTLKTPHFLRKILGILRFVPVLERGAEARAGIGASRSAVAGEILRTCALLAIVRPASKGGTCLGPGEMGRSGIGPGSRRSVAQGFFPGLAGGASSSSLISFLKSSRLRSALKAESMRNAAALR
jgi:hypothetical protein